MFSTSLKKILFSLFFFGFGSTLLFISCKNDDTSPSNDTEVLLRAQLRNIYENEVIGLNTDFVQATTILEQVAKTFQNEVNSQNLEQAREQWRNVQLIWKRLELYDLGDVANSFVAFEINRWPTNPTRIENNIIGTEPLNESFIASQGSSSKGISGIEYLLFPSEENQDILTLFSGENANRRTQYLVAMTENLSIKAVELNNIWEAYSPTFTTALENGINGGQNQVANAMITLIEEIILSKLGRALGDANGGTIAIDELEAFRSAFSKSIIQQHLIALERCYSGNFSSTTSTTGFDDFLMRLDQAVLAERIEDQFAACQTALNGISGSIADALQTNSTSTMALRTAFRDLLVLIKVDMANTLGVTVTFNDNDGD